MRLGEALNNITLLSSTGAWDSTEINSLVYDSRAVKPGSLYVALRGQKTDGHRYLEQARLAGAAALLVEAPPSGEWEIPILQVADTRRALATVAANFYGHPSRELKTLAVTGTNGKSTTAWLLHHLCNTALFRAGFIGTFGYFIGDQARDADRTTPEAPELQAMLREILDAGGRAVSFEASSHAIVQQRVAEVDLNVLVFTNLTQDHLDYHGTMEAYYQAKAKGFHQMAAQKEKRGNAIINIDDHYGRRLVKELKAAYKDGQLRVITYGLGGQADFRAADFQSSRQGQQFTMEALGRRFLVRSPLLGRFNLYNTLAALAAIQCIGVDLRTAIAALPDAPQVPGRMQLVPIQAPFTVFVDYAHTDDALANVLKTANELPHRHLRVVFGCGGDRDRAKRPKMAAAAEQYAEYVYVTSDNPRTEEPEAILREIVAGLRKPPRLVEVDRRKAIYAAVQEARDGDIVIIAGKGHENYQELATGRVDFDDVKVAQEALRAVHEGMQLDKMRERQAEILEKKEAQEQRRRAREEAARPRRNAADVARERAAQGQETGEAQPNAAERPLSAKDVARRRRAANWLEENNAAEGNAPAPTEPAPAPESDPVSEPETKQGGPAEDGSS